jgi:hypothetical protein
MNASIIITTHAAERIAERVEPVLGDRAVELVEDFVLDAVWNHRFRRRAPRWMRARAIVRGEQVRYAVGRIDGLRFVAVVALERGSDPVLVTVIAERVPGAPAQLAPVPALADGRVIGLPRTTPLPIAFQRVAA